jgi:hypothetical protein
VNVPRATVFFVTDRDHEPPFPIWAVTARHNIQEARAEAAPMFVRVNTTDETYIDLPTTPDDWFEDDAHDVAVCYWAGTSDRIRLTSVPFDQFIQDDYRYYGGKDLPLNIRELGGQEVIVGHEIFFVGLFNQHAGKAKNLPIARFGNVARLPVEPVNVRRKDGTVEQIHGYLCEARSWGGHSGSPVFWTYPVSMVRFVDPPAAPAPNRAARRSKRPAPKPASIPVTTGSEIIALMGLVSAHFDIPQTAEVEGDALARVITRSNAGIAVVTPAHVILELLRREDVVAEKDKYRKPAAEREEAPAATFDYVSEESEFDRFEELARKLVNTSKKEIAEKRKESSD